MASTVTHLCDGHMYALAIGTPEPATRKRTLDLGRGPRTVDVCAGCDEWAGPLIEILGVLQGRLVALYEAGVPVEMEAPEPRPAKAVPAPRDAAPSERIQVQCGQCSAVVSVRQRTDHAKRHKVPAHTIRWTVVGDGELSAPCPDPECQQLDYRAVDKRGLRAHTLRYHPELVTKD